MEWAPDRLILPSIHWFEGWSSPGIWAAARQRTRWRSRSHFWQVHWWRSVMHLYIVILMCTLYNNYCLMQGECAECRSRCHIWQVKKIVSKCDVAFLLFTLWHFSFSNNLCNICHYLGFLLSLSIKWEICKWTKRSWAAFEPLFSSTQVPGSICWSLTNTFTTWGILWVILAVLSLQMLKASPTPVKWSSLEKKSMHHWKPIANRDTQSSKGGKCGPLVLYCVAENVWRLNVIAALFIAWS